MERAFLDNRKPRRASFEFLKDPLFGGIVLLQFALFGIVGPSINGDCLSLNELWTTATKGSISEGSHLPAFTTYDDNGDRQAALTKGKPSVLIFKADCSCDMLQVTGWTKVSQRQGESVTVIVPVSPSDLARVRRESQVSARLLSIRTDELLRLKMVQKNMPIAVHLLPDGTVRSIQTQ